MIIPAATWLLVMLFCYMHLCSHVSVVSALCLDDQRSLLLQFKNTSTISDAENSSGRLRSWDESIDCCQWSGVTCDHDGHVVGLDLSGESISSNISSSLFGLHHLESLNLAYNIFQWAEIPSEFNKLENLTYLNLSHAGFVGQIPIEISQLKRLVTLDVSYRGLKLENPNLRKFFQNLTNIRQLYLDGVNVSAQGQEWTDALLQIPTLQELSMPDCGLSGPLQPSLAILENLSMINLKWNNFSSPVPQSYASFKNLATLNLADCGLIGVFPQKIFQVPSLSFIDISINGRLQGSFPDFPENRYLRTLSVGWTNFSGPFPYSMGNLSHLSSLILLVCQFSGTLPNSFSNLTQLVEIDLPINGFFGPVPSLSKKLQSLDLSGNSFSGAIPSTHFKGLVNLAYINISQNFFSGEIPTSLFMLPSLEQVTLSNNKFKGLLNVSMNATSKINVLDLSNNYLEGISTFDLSGNNLSKMGATKRPFSFPLFPNLEFVSMASCELTTFPQFLKNHSQLVALDFSNNHITGIVPHWISKLESLYILNVSNNYLTNWEEPLLSNMSNLLILDLHSNHLSGPLPALPLNLEYLDFSSNNLSSSIPPNICNNLLHTVFVSLSSNNLYGNIPESTCNATSLLFLDLSNNALTGTIPPCLSDYVVLDLGRNKLNGTFDAFPDSCHLRSLYLNGNSLQGKLSRNLINCAKLEVLDLGENQIEDRFPCWLKSIPSLRVLILRSNKLHGSLQCEGTQSGWPLLQIFDVSSNNFGDRIPPSFFETWRAMMTGENGGKNINLTRSDLSPFELPLIIITGHYYQDKVTVTSKDQKMELVKIQTIFTAVDLSNNKFEGSIPEDLGQLNALYVLNLSHNVFSGHIPSSLGNMKDLESLDLSNNSLSGHIPTELASLSFLEFMNLSYNHLVGNIPTGTQIQSFEASSFKGNDGLCGPPLTPNCSGGVQVTPPVASNSNKENSIDWNIIAAEVGFASAIGIIVLLLVFHKAWRIWYWEKVDNTLYRIFPQMDFVVESRGGKNYRVIRWMAY